MNLYDSLLAPRLKPMITIHDCKTLTLTVDGVAHTFNWCWDNDMNDVTEWAHTFISIHHGSDPCIWIQFFPWLNYADGKRLEDRDTIYIYNGNNGTEAYVQGCIVVDEQDVLGAKQDVVINEAVKVLEEMD
jgi:hypothetical protein